MKLRNSIIFDVATHKAVCETDLTDGNIMCCLYELLCAKGLKDEAEHAVFNLAQDRRAKMSETMLSILIEIFGDRQEPTYRVIVFETDYNGYNSVDNIFEGTDLDYLGECVNANYSEEFVDGSHSPLRHVYINGKPTEVTSPDVFAAAQHFMAVGFED